MRLGGIYVLERLAQDFPQRDYPTREIGRELYVSVSTVRSQVQSIYRKLKATSRAEAVLRARHLGLLRGSTAMGPQADFT